MTLEEILEEFPHDEFLKPDGYEKAVIGYENGSMRLVMSVPLMIQIGIDDMEMSELESREWLDYNVLSAYIGENTPIYVWDRPFE